MHFYASRWDGTGQPGDEFRPRGTEHVPDEAGWHALDLRADPTSAGGFCFWACDLHLASVDVTPGVVYLGDDPDEVRESLVDLIRSRFPRLAARMRDDLPAGRRNLRNIVAYLLVDRAADTGVALRPQLVDGVQRLRIWLGGLLVDTAVPAGGATETWDVADQDNNIDADYDWTILGSQLDIDSLAVSEITGATDAWARCEEDIGDVDHEATLHGNMPANQSGRNLWFGPAVRFDAAALTNYHMQFLVRSGNGNAARLFKTIGGSGTQLANPSWSSSNNTGAHAFRLMVSGSTLTWYVDAVEVSSITDTSITTGTRVGLYTNRNTGYSGTSLYTSFDFTDPAAGGAVNATAAFVLPAPTLSGTADVDVDAAAAFQLAAPTLAATVQVPVDVTATFTLPAPTLAAAADVDLAATAAFELPAPTLAAAVTTGEDVANVAAAFVLPAPTLAGAGDLDVDTTAAFALAAPTLSATVDTPADITASFGLPAPTLAATGDLDLAAAANYALPTPQLAATADVDVDATATLTLPAPTLAATIAGVAIVPALERTYPIRAELRVVPLPTETRTYPVAAEPRTYAAIPE